ncbi:MAG: glutathione peroxidase [Bacilli bacterium]|nr:glutathione peroxidase [Bacilli bacterium]
MAIYDIKVTNTKGEEVTLEEYKGKVLLIVNTATGCGFTPQYEGLEKLYKEYREQGFEILDFPCNQFFGQAPGSDEQIHEFCTLKYNTTFPRYKKIDVKGKNQAPIFAWLVEQKNGSEKGKKPSWNFCKYLINKEGEFVKMFGPTTKPESLEGDIKAELAK